jgi:hypothetical protein
MSIVGDHPETGARVEAQRERAGGPPWRYAGEVVTPTDRFPLSAVIAGDGTVTVADLDPSAPPGLAEKARLLLRAAFKHASAEGAPPPRRIVRWRADV